jgi:hypothetical protein
MPPKVLASRMKAADKNQDGKLSKEEAPGFLKQHFERIDADKDGQLDPAELKKAGEAARKHIQATFAKRYPEAAKRIKESPKKVGDPTKPQPKKPMLMKPAPKKPLPKKPIEKKVEEKK